MADIGEETGLATLPFTSVSDYKDFTQLPSQGESCIADDSEKKETSLSSVVKWVCNVPATSEGALFEMHCVFGLANVKCHASGEIWEISI